MSNWANGVLTKAGRELQAKVEASLATLSITKIKLGDGTESIDNVDNLTDLVSPKANLSISSAVAEDNVATITGIIANSQLNTGFYVREWGLFATDPDEGEILYMVTIDSQPEWLPPSTAQAQITATYAMNIAIANATNIYAQVDLTGLVDVEMLQAATSEILRSTAYNVGDCRTHPSMNGDLYLECTTAGTTSPNILQNLNQAQEGDTIQDGTVVWTVRQNASRAWVRQLFRSNPQLTVIPSIMQIQGVGNIKTASVTYLGSGSLVVSSSDENVATAEYDPVNHEITVINVGEGTAQITCYLYPTDAYSSATVYINVTCEAIVDPNLTISPTTVATKIGQTAAINYSYQGNGTMTVTSANTSIATVTTDGIGLATVTGVGNGVTTINFDLSGTSTYAAASAAANVTIKNAAYPYLSISPTSALLLANSDPVTITATYQGDGILSATTSNPNVCTTAISGHTVILTGHANGSTNVTISTSETSTYYADSVILPVRTVDISPTLADNSPAQIKAAIQQGIAPNLWNVGDVLTIHLQGTLGAGSLNDDFQFIILGFNHNSSIEGEKSIHFMLNYSDKQPNTQIGLVDNYYATTWDKVPNPSFQMNSTRTNANGWAGSFMYNTLCPQALQCFPASWQDIISNCIKYSNNKGGTTITATDITSTSAKIWLMSEKECYGNITTGSNYEDQYQQQYTFFANGNSKQKFSFIINNKNIDTSHGYMWWLRTATVSQYYFVSVPQVINTSTDRQSLFASYSRGFVPCFAIIGDE